MFEHRREEELRVWAQAGALAVGAPVNSKTPGAKCTRRPAEKERKEIPQTRQAVAQTTC